MHFNFNDRPTKKLTSFFGRNAKTCNVQNVFGSVFIDFDVVVWVFDCFFFSFLKRIQPVNLIGDNAFVLVFITTLRVLR